jgi:hypothetical protein
MGGYLAIDLGDFNIIRSMFGYRVGLTMNAYLGRSSGFSMLNVSPDGTTTNEVNRTPAGYVSNPLNTWTMDAFTSTLDGLQEYIVASFAPNLDDIANTTEGGIFYGDVNATTPLVPVGTPTPITTSGGIVFSAPFLIAYGNGGVIYWTSDDGDINSWPDENFLVLDNTKIVKGIDTRGGGTPTLLFWSLGKLIRVSYNGTLNTFTKDVIQPNISILSPNSVVTFDNQTTYWIGNNCFYSYTGVVQTVPNTMNSDWFFNNLNRQYASKIFGIVNHRYGEIMWFFPFGESTECNACIILQPGRNIWYDNRINRAAGLSDDILETPLLSDNQTVATNTGTQTILTYPLWQHEVGYNEVINGNTYAIDSYFESHLHSLIKQGDNRSLRTRRIELDFVQNGNMTLEIKNRLYQRSDPIIDGPYTFDPTITHIDSSSQGFFDSYLFRSNTTDGYYQMGNCILNLEPGDFKR